MASNPNSGRCLCSGRDSSAVLSRASSPLTRPPAIQGLRPLARLRVQAASRPAAPGRLRYHHPRQSCHLPRFLSHGDVVSTVLFHTTCMLNVSETTGRISQNRLDYSSGMARPGGRRQLPTGKTACDSHPQEGGAQPTCRATRGHPVSQGAEGTGDLY